MSDPFIIKTMFNGGFLNMDGAHQLIMVVYCGFFHILINDQLYCANMAFFIIRMDLRPTSHPKNYPHGKG